MRDAFNLGVQMSADNAEVTYDNLRCAVVDKESILKLKI